jgi:hypothetical protein
MILGSLQPWTRRRCPTSLAGRRDKRKGEGMWVRRQSNQEEGGIAGHRNKRAPFYDRLTGLSEAHSSKASQPDLTAGWSHHSHGPFHDEARQWLSQGVSRPCTSAGGDVASIALNDSVTLYWWLAPAGTSQESPALRSRDCPSSSSVALPEMT